MFIRYFSCLLLALLLFQSTKMSWGVEPKLETVRVVVLGDSITRGVRTGVGRDEIYQTLIHNMLTKPSRELEVLNQGIGGERTDQALKRLDKSVISLKPDIVTVMYGTNDSYVDIGKNKSRISADAYEQNLRQIAERLQDAGIQVVLMTEPRWGAAAKNNGVGEHPNLRLEKYLDRCRKVAQEMKLPLVDHYSHWKQQEEAGVVIGEWTTDQCHPNGTGHAELAKIMKPVLEQVLQKMADGSD